MSAEGYKSEIINSNREFTKREELKFKEVADCLSLDKVCNDDSSTLIEVDIFAVIHIENPTAKNPEYDVCVIVDKEGKKYKTGSQTFINSLLTIYGELKEAGELEEGLTISVFKKQSKNFDGKFINCCLA